MGILNVTPDSFSDGGLAFDPGDAVRRAFELEDLGADIIDVGAESTRPGAVPVDAAEEIRRLSPVLGTIASSLRIPVSVDTMKAEVAEFAAGQGASIINDVNGLRGEGMMRVCAESGINVIVMHSPDEIAKVHSGFMGDGFEDEITGFLRERTEAAMAAGIPRRSIMVDPGIGFGKTPGQNIYITRNMRRFSVGFPTVAALSRKRFLSEMYPGMDRDAATLEALKAAADSGADVVRVHDVGPVAEMFRI